MIFDKKLDVLILTLIEWDRRDNLNEESLVFYDFEDIVQKLLFRRR